MIVALTYGQWNYLTHKVASSEIQETKFPGLFRMESLDSKDTKWIRRVTRNEYEHLRKLKNDQYMVVELQSSRFYIVKKCKNSG